MQNRYVGDVGDFAKYGLLRVIARGTGRRIGVVWYLFSDESHNSDGRHVGYLRDPSSIRLDPPLHSALAKLVSTGQRTVRAVARAGILPTETVYFESSISDHPDRPVSRQQRARARASWIKRALAATEPSEIVFFDPDNGLETASVQRHSPKSGKYVFWDELVPFWQRGQSLLIYHHLNRTATVARQAEILRERFSRQFSDAALLNFVLARRGSCRHFWLVGQEKHAVGLRRAIEGLGQSEWREYLEVG